MSRYIDAEKISYFVGARMQILARKEVIDEVPTADVEEVRHGKDIYYKVCDTHCEFKCSLCNAWIAIVEGGTLDAARGFNYCPACGAKLDKEQEG